MSRDGTRSPVLAIAIDAADGRLIRHLAAEGRLPTLGRLIETGRWGTVRAPAEIGSGSVWPTFTTGEAPDRHGIFGEYSWDADGMRLRRPSFHHLDPFWRRVAEGGRRVTVVDVPFAPVLRHERLIEIADWGAHDWFGGAPLVHPPRIEAALADLLEPRHPLAAGRVDSDGPGDVEGLAHVVRSLVAGARQRGALAERLLRVAPTDLLLVVFTEAHRASHLLWHTLDESHPAWREHPGSLPAEIMSGLVEVFQTVDDQIGRLIARAGHDPSVLVFALHGMQPARGIPAFLNDVLEHWGLAVRRRGWQRSPREMAGAALKSVKQRVPGSLKVAYYSRVPKAVTLQLAQPSMPMPPWDWARTRAFSLPTDQHGWIRLNLAGRESLGAVPLSAYDATCLDLKSRLLALSSPDGPLVRDVLLTAAAAGGPPRHLPDLIVHWTPQTWRPRLRLLDPPIESIPVGLKFVSQHDDEGFFVGTGGGIEGWPDVVDAAELGEKIGFLR